MKKFILAVLALGFTIGFAACSEDKPVSDVNQGATISGLVDVSPDLKAKITGNEVLFIIARKDVGPPLAVKKIPAPQFPVAYVLSDQDVMFPGTPFQGEVKVVARVDKDGMAGPAQAGDFEGTSTKNPARVGDRDVDVTINTVH